MTQQTIATGSSANDGTGDTLRNAGTKINANFTELYGYLGLHHSSETITADGAASASTPYTICNKASGNLNLALADASSVGQVKVFTNKGADPAIITPSNFAQGSTITLDQYDAATLVWDGSNWYITGHYDATVA